MFLGALHAYPRFLATSLNTKIYRVCVRVVLRIRQPFLWPVAIKAEIEKKVLAPKLCFAFFELKWQACMVMVEGDDILLVTLRDTSPNYLIKAVFEQIWIVPKEVLNLSQKF